MQVSLAQGRKVVRLNSGVRRQPEIHVSTSTTAVIVAMAAHRRRLIRHFVEASAFTPDSAIPETSLPRVGFRLVSKLRDNGVILATPDGRLYLDRARWDVLTQARHNRAKVALAVVVIAAFCLLGWTYFKAAA